MKNYWNYVLSQKIVIHFYFSEIKIQEALVIYIIKYFLDISNVFLKEDSTSPSHTTIRSQPP